MPGEIVTGRTAFAFFYESKLLEPEPAIVETRVLDL
jgi:hypothetical protein